MFEVFAIVAVLTAEALTAALCIDQLHADEPIGNRDLTQTAMPEQTLEIGGDEHLLYDVTDLVA